MKKLSLIALTVALTLLSSCTHFSEEAEVKAGKTIVGETAFIAVDETGLVFDSRIDTGATTTSINAFDIHIKGKSKKKQDNINKLITFKTRNKSGETAVVSTRIVNVVMVSNSQGTEARYVVNLTLHWKGSKRKVRVNLRDRQKMTYKLLIGRNWLNGKYLVDVSLKEHGKESSKATPQKKTFPVKLHDYKNKLGASFWDKASSAIYPDSFSLIEADGKKMFRLKFPGQEKSVVLEPAKSSKKSIPVALAILTINGTRVKYPVQLMKQKKGVDLFIGTDLKEKTYGDNK
ncbi:RimK/LysX family protein [Lentisphaera profundi]|uniref:RimK/LysX family protein n=1 Tax=Lentisphaera profundi TaxID=1658616 RepID=A0ABY7VRH6_9BACT|nr:RimK/LysX family protein [Lentisphaera profundi]WDE95828.1 RimK/LysX family protein [Lentisphaera profundi]